MAGYRPKSLEELNDMYGKTIAAEKAIRKGTSLFEQSEKSDESSETVKEHTDSDSSEIKQSQELSDAVSEFIARYSADSGIAVQQQRQTEKPKPLVTVMTKEPVKADEPVAEKTAVNAFQIANQEAVRQQPQERISQRTDRDELMDEYMRIMSDEEDDDVPEKKVSRKEKKRKKKKDKEALTEAVQDEELPQETEDTFYETAEEQQTESSDVLFGENITEAPEEQSAETEAESYEENIVSEENNDFDFPENYTPEWIEKDIEKEETQKEKAKGKKARKKKKAQNKKQKETESEVLDEAPEVTLSYELEDTEIENEIIDEPVAENKKEKKAKGGKGFLKGILGTVLVIFIAAGIFATVFETVLSVNTGKSVADNYYLFTAQKTYADLSVNEGDLIVTEKVYAEDGDVFAYIDYSEKTFEFGKRTDSITNDDGEVLIVTETGGARTLVARDDCKGVVYTSYPVIGKYIGLITENYVAVMAAIAVISVLIVVALAFLSKEKKAKLTDNEGEDASSEGEYEEENLFATID